MNLNFRVIKRMRSTVRKVVKAAAARISTADSDREWREAFFAILKTLRPWPEASWAWPRPGCAVRTWPAPP